MKHQLEELSEEEKEKRKNKRKREQLLQQQMASNRKKISVVKSMGKVFGFPLKVFFDTLESDKGIAAFLDASGIKKKPNYQKEIAENTAATAKHLKELNTSLHL